MGGSRRFDDREVGLILERVARLHEQQGHKTDARSMSEAEIEQVVAELGISKALVARAVSELSVQDLRNRKVWWLGGKTDVMFESAVDGTLDDAAHGRMLEVLRRHLGEPGKLETEGGARIWSTTSSRRIHLTVVEDDGATTVRLEERMPMDARATVGLSAMLGWFAGIMMVIPLKAVVVKAVLLMMMFPAMLVGAGAGWLAGRALWARRSQSRADQLRRAFDEVTAIAEGRAVRAAPSEGADET